MNSNQLKTQFFDHFHIQHGQKEAQLTPPTSTVLSELQVVTCAVHRRSPAPVLSQEERESLSGKRFAALPEAMERCAEGLAKHPRITAATGVSPATLRHALELDTVGVRIAQGCAEVHARSGDAIRAVAGQAEALSTSALQTADGFIQQGAPSYLKQLFADALLGQQGARNRTRARAERSEGRAAPLKAQTQEARARLEEARTLARFLLKQKED